MIRALHILLVLSLLGCSSDPEGVEPTPDDGVDASNTDVGSNDAAAVDADDRDMGGEDDVDADAVSDMEPQVVCESLAAGACMADPACTLDGGCVRRNDADPFSYLQTGAWVGTAQITEQLGLPGGTTDVVLMLHRDNPREVRGVVSFPAFDIDHTVWGGVGPTGELGLFFGTPRCAEPRCDAAFGPAYDVGGLATDLTVELDNVLVDSTVTEFQTFVDMQLTPSDGFKPVGPIFPRADVLVAAWKGDMIAVNETGELLDLFCEFEVAATVDGAHDFTDFGCMDAGRLDVREGIDDADGSTIVYANGLAWFATGPDPDDLAFVGRVRVEEPWQGVVARRGDLLDGGVPIDPEDVPLDAVRGTFAFYAFNTGL